jgi:lipoate-protein ligase A
VAATDEGKGAEFKGKTVEMKDKGEFAILLAFKAGKDVIATTNGDKETDVHLFVYNENKKEVGKDTSPGPKCEVKFTPTKDAKFKLVVRNSGGANKVTLEVKISK